MHAQNATKLHDMPSYCRLHEQNQNFLEKEDMLNNDFMAMETDQSLLLMSKNEVEVQRTTSQQIEVCSRSIFLCVHQRYWMYLSVCVSEILYASFCVCIRGAEKLLSVLLLFK